MELEKSEDYEELAIEWQPVLWIVGWMSRREIRHFRCC